MLGNQPVQFYPSWLVRKVKFAINPWYVKYKGRPIQPAIQSNEHGVESMKETQWIVLPVPLGTLSKCSISIAVRHIRLWALP